MTMTTKSNGHQAFIGSVEYYMRGSDLHRAPIDNPVMPDGFRSGRFEAPAHLVEMALKLARQYQ